MGRAKRLTAYEQKFVDGIVDGLTQSDAYRQAGYKIDNMDAAGIATQAYRVSNKPHIQTIIAQKQKELAEKEIWTKARALGMLVKIAEDGLKHSTKDGNYNAANANSAIKAIEQANKMTGFNEPEKHDVDATIQIILGDADEYAD